MFEEGFSPSDRGLSEEEITAYLHAPRGRRHAGVLACDILP